jgi:hypothetical protein
MDISKFKNLKAVKRTVRLEDVKIIKKHTNRKKAPHAIKCEVLLLLDEYFAVIGDTRYPLKFRKEDYLNAEYAYSSKNNPNWDLHTLKSYRFDEKYLDKIKVFWDLIIPGIKAYVNIIDGIAYLNMDRMNNKMKSIINKHKPSYYVNRRHPVF